MPIMGLDISLFQEYDWSFINWKELKSDPLNFRFLWVKCQEGSIGPNDLGSYSLDIVKRQVAGAQSVGFEAINLYHYYWYQYQTLSGTWQIVDAKAQAKAFYDTWVASGLPITAHSHPLTDLEDVYIGQFLLWSDTDSANKAIVFARKLNLHLKTYHQEITNLFGVRPDIYTGGYWLDKFVPLLRQNGYASEVAWLDDYRFVLAEYNPTLRIPSYIPKEHVIAWQKTSTPSVPVKGIPTGHNVPGDALDIDQWMLSEDEYNLWAGIKEVSTMPNIYNKSVPIIDRGRFVWLSAEDTNIDFTGINNGANAAFLRMASQASGNMTVVKDTAFPIWTDRATIPVLGVVKMDQNLFWNKEIDLTKFQARTMWTNETLRAILEQWHIAQIPNAEWDAKHLNIVATSGWHKISGLVLFMSTTTAKGSPINAMWQMAIVDDLLKPLTTLMQGGYIPNVPIYLMASGNWYAKYTGDAAWQPQNRIASKQLAGMGVTRVWGANESGLITDSAPMATPFQTLKEIWAYGPDNSYSYPFIIEGVDYSFFIFSWNRLCAVDMFYPGATVTPVVAGIWNDTKTIMYDALKFENIIVPPPEDTTIEDLVKRIESEITVLQNDVKNLKVLLKIAP